jgi:CRP-like cAMP-binding protein
MTPFCAAPVADRPVTGGRPCTEVDTALEEHAVLRLMPDRAKDLVRQYGRSRRMDCGDQYPGPTGVTFVTTGALAAFDRRSLACVGLFGPGAAFGWDRALTSRDHPVPLLALVDVAWIELEGDHLASAMDPVWLEHVFARHALDRLERLEADAACNAVHPIPHRTANWIRRLAILTGPELRTTQGLIARTMGVQRTSAHAAVKALERDGAIRLFRGRIRVTDPARLARFACGC